MAFELFSGTPRAQENNLYRLPSPGRELRVKFLPPLSKQTAHCRHLRPASGCMREEPDPWGSLLKPQAPGWGAPVCHGGAPRVRNAKKGMLELKEIRRGSCPASPQLISAEPRSVRSLCERGAVVRPGRKHCLFPQCTAPEALRTSAPHV